MKTVAMFLSAGLVIIGQYHIMVNANMAGVPVMILGALSFLILSKEPRKTKTS